MEVPTMRLNVKAMALAGGIFCGGGVFILTWWLILLGQEMTMNTLVRAFPNYTVTPLGSLLGLIWGFVDGLIGGLIFAWLYNLFVPKAEKT